MQLARIYAILLFLIVYLVLASCRLNNSADNVISDTEYAVYRALIEERSIKHKDQLIVIYSETVSRAFHKWDKFPVLPETIDSFERRNQHSQTIDGAKLGLSVPCTILEKEAFQELMTKYDEASYTLPNRWDGFYKAYPNANGMIKLSRVGFDTKESQALVWVGHAADYLIGISFFVLLVRNKDGAWNVDNWILATIS